MDWPTSVTHMFAVVPGPREIDCTLLLKFEQHTVLM